MTPAAEGSARGGAGGHGQVPAVRPPLANPHDAHVPPAATPPMLQWGFIASVVALLALAVVFLILERWRRAGAALGVAFVVLALARWLVDSERLGILAVRSRRFDSMFCAAMGASMLFLALSVDSLGS